MDMMLEEELIDLMTFCLQNPNSSDISNNHTRIIEIGGEIYADGGADALENFCFVLKKQDYSRNRKRSIATAFAMAWPC